MSTFGTFSFLNIHMHALEECLKLCISIGIACARDVGETITDTLRPFPPQPTSTFITSFFVKSGAKPYTSSFLRIGDWRSRETELTSLNRLVMRTMLGAFDSFPTLVQDWLRNSLQ